MVYVRILMCYMMCMIDVSQFDPKKKSQGIADNTGKMNL